jgi:hypothetical protein
MNLKLKRREMMEKKSIYVFGETKKLKKIKLGKTEGRFKCEKKKKRL